MKNGKPNRLTASIENVMQIVEGMRRKRWTDGKMRLVDTPEWCEFYVAWYAAKRANKPKASARRSNDQAQRPAE